MDCFSASYGLTNKFQMQNFKACHDFLTEKNSVFIEITCEILAEILNFQTIFDFLNLNFPRVYFLQKSFTKQRIFIGSHGWPMRKFSLSSA